MIHSRIIIANRHSSKFTNLDRISSFIIKQHHSSSNRYFNRFSFKCYQLSIIEIHNMFSIQFRHQSIIRFLTTIIVKLFHSFIYQNSRQRSNSMFHFICQNFQLFNFWISQSIKVCKIRHLLFIVVFFLTFSFMINWANKNER